MGYKQIKGFLRSFKNLAAVIIMVMLSCITLGLTFLSILMTVALLDLGFQRVLEYGQFFINWWG